MKNRDIIRRAARSLRHAKARTILTSLAIAVGAFTITLSLAAGEGARQYADKLISSNVNPQAVYVVKEKAMVDGSQQQAPINEYSDSENNASQTSSGRDAIKMLSQTDIDTLAKLSSVRSITPSYSVTSQYIQFGDSAATPSAKKFTAGITTYDPSIIATARSGALPVKNVSIKDDDIVVPGSFVATLVEKGVIKTEADLIGMPVTITVAKATATPSSDAIAAAYARGGSEAVTALTQPETKTVTFHVVAVTGQSSAAMSSISDLQVSAKVARDINEYTTKGTSSYQKYYSAIIVAKDGVNTATVKTTLENKGYGAQTAKDLQSMIFTVVNTLQGIVLGFGLIALLASVFGIINTQYISVLERTREIGLMKALGMRRRSVSRLFQYEAAWIGLLGGVIGSVIAVIAGTALNPWITTQLELGDGTALLIFQPLPIAVMIIVLIIIAMLAGWFPARKAAKLDPIEALRTE